jgi:hypothetical protein
MEDKTNRKADLLMKAPKQMGRVIIHLGQPNREEALVVPVNAATCY